MNKCPCVSGKAYVDCCEPLHKGKLIAETAEQLMRSRYSAFSLKNVDYLVDTLHISEHKKDERISLEDSLKQTKWLGLRIIDKSSSAETATVEFVAYYENKPVGQLHERSRFVKEKGQWFYVDGDILPATKLARNDICFCGSNKKLKKCHLK